MRGSGPTFIVSESSCTCWPVFQVCMCWGDEGALAHTHTHWRWDVESGGWSVASRCCSQWLLLASEKIGTQVRMKTFPGTQWGWFLSPLHFFFWAIIFLFSLFHYFSSSFTLHFQTPAAFVFSFLFLLYFCQIVKRISLHWRPFVSTVKTWVECFCQLASL